MHLTSQVLLLGIPFLHGEKEKVNNFCFWLVFFFWNRSVFSLHIWQKTCLPRIYILRRRDFSFPFRKEQQERSIPDSKPPHFSPGRRSDLADYCNWEREINMKTLPLGTLWELPACKEGSWDPLMAVSCLSLPDTIGLSSGK